MNIAIITSGGDSPGMNPCIAQLVKEATSCEHKVFAYERGFLGIRDHNIYELNINKVQDWYKLGGTMLRTGRFPELSEPKWQKQLSDNLKADGIDVLIVI